MPRAVASKLKIVISRFLAMLRQFPLVVLGVLVLGLLALITVSSQLQQDEIEEAAVEQVRTVDTFVIGEQPTVAAIASVEQTGEITIVAQTPGIVQQIAVEPGDEIAARKRVVSLSSNYYGGNSAGLQSSLARTQYQHALDTLDAQKEGIALQRNLAESNLDNADELRRITRRSIDETKTLIDLNEELLDTVELVITESTISAEVQAAKQSKAQLLGVTNQLRQALRNAEYQADSDAPPAEMADLQKQITLNQLDLQEKALELNVAVAKLQSQIAAVSAAQMYPAAPFSGTVQRVHVRVGEAVNPGTPLVTIYCDQLVARLRVALSPEMAARITPFAQSMVQLPSGQHFYTQPTFVSQVPTSGGFITAEYVVPESIGSQLSGVRQVQMRIPVQAPTSLSSQLFVPIDAVHQTERVSEVFVIDQGVARSRQVELGPVLGAYVLVTAGLSIADEVIIDRVVVDGQAVQVRSTSAEEVAS